MKKEIETLKKKEYSLEEELNEKNDKIEKLKKKIKDLMKEIEEIKKANDQLELKYSEEKRKLNELERKGANNIEDIKNEILILKNKLEEQEYLFNQKLSQQKNDLENEFKFKFER